MSAEQHRTEALSAEQAAGQERARYDANAVAVAPGAVTPFAAYDYPFVFRTYNPTAGHLAAAQQHLREAKEHLAAAKELERFEGEACAGVPQEMRASCPFVTASVESLEETARGVLLHLLPGAKGVSVFSAMRCHLAFARTRGYPPDTQCPLYFKGVSVELTQAGRTIEIRGDNARTAVEIRRQAAALFSPAILENAAR